MTVQDVQAAILGRDSAECPHCRREQALAKFAKFYTSRAGALVIDCRCNEKEGGCGGSWVRMDYSR